MLYLIYRMKRLVVGVTGIVLLFAGAQGVDALAPVIPSPKTVGAPLSLTIEEDGDTALQGARITQITGTTIFAAQYWGLLPVRWIIRTDSKTLITHRFGNPIVFSQLSVGDFVSAEGAFNGGSDTLGIDAKSIKDWSVSTEGSSFTGTIASAPDQNGSFILQLGDGNTVFVKPKPGASVARGVVAIAPSAIAQGDRVLETTGVYNHLDRSLEANIIKIFQDKKKFAARNFEGELMRLDSTALPTTMLVKTNDGEYRVFLSEKTEIVKKNRAKTTLVRFIAGDTLRFYGALREADWTAVDAEIIRTLEF